LCFPSLEAVCAFECGGAGGGGTGGETFSFTIHLSEEGFDVYKGGFVVVLSYKLLPLPATAMCM
jgi:hypothetical protein